MNSDLTVILWRIGQSLQMLIYGNKINIYMPDLEEIASLNAFLIYSEFSNKQKILFFFKYWNLWVLYELYSEEWVWST